MGGRRVVMLDPDGSIGGTVPRMYVVVEAATGISYEQQLRWPGKPRWGKLTADSRRSPLVAR